MAGKFEIYKDKAGEYRFRLKASNGQNILASEMVLSQSRRTLQTMLVMKGKRPLLENICSI
jgi:hypothetical protein